MADEEYVVELRIDLKSGNIGGQLANELAKVREGTDGFDKEIQKVEKGLAGADGASKKMNQSLASTRYALYDVSAAMTGTGIALLALAAAPMAVAIAWERDFANVARTSGATGEALADLRGEFVDLAQSIPVSFADLTDIGTLGGQLGIAADDLADFTSVVAKLTATTDLSGEAAGTALGRFQALLGVPGEDFDNLASSILKVGVNSVATETQIVNISTQISSMGAFAGLTAEQVVGLSGALASVGAAPEISRGTITRTFTLMSRAIAAGGERLDEFARISGMSADQFKSTWGTEQFGATFQSFLKGIDAEGGNAVAALNNLGITSVRDVPLLMRLAAAGDVVTQSFADSATGFREATELNEQYAIVAETTAAKLQVLGNSFASFLDAVGSANLGPLKGVLDFVTGFFGILESMSRDSAGGAILGIAVIITGLIGVLALMGGAMTAAAASTIAVDMAMKGLAASSPSAAAGLLGASNAAAVAAGTMSGAQAAALRLISALKILGAITLVLALPDIARQANSWVDDLKGFENDFEAVRDRISTKGIYFDESVLEAALRRADGSFNNFAMDMERLSANLGFGSAAALDLKKLDDQMAAVAQSGNIKEVQAEIDSLGIPAEKLKSVLPETAKAIDEYHRATGEAVGPAATAAAEMEAMEIAAENLATAIGLVPEELEILKGGLDAGYKGFYDYGDLIQRVQDKTRGWAEAQSEDAYGSKDSWQQWYDGSSVNIQDFMALLDQQIANQSVWADDLARLTAAGATAFVSEIAKMGPEGAPLAAAAVTLIGGELGKLEDQARLSAFLASEAFANTFTEQTPMLVAAYAAGGIEAVNGMITAQRQQASGEIPGAVVSFVESWNSTYAANPIKMPVDANTDPALASLNDFIYMNNGRRVSVFVDTVAGSRAPGWAVMPENRASGGYISGPGTGTSDSIPANLSNGEYVIKAASVQKFGVGYMDALNRGQTPRGFSTGGPVGGGGGSFPTSMMTESSPTDRALLRNIADRIGNMEVQFVDVARAAAYGDELIGRRGGR